MHILINGWFWGDDTSGSGQYLHYLVGELPRLFSTEASQITLIVPQRQDDSVRATLPKGIFLYSADLPPIPRQLAKVWWEQITIPNIARRMKADTLWVPYWAAPCWQPVPTVATIHDIIPLLLPVYQGGQLQRIYTSLVSFSARRCKAIITVSEASRRDVIQHLGIAASKVVAVLSGPNQSTNGLTDIVNITDIVNKRIRKKYSLPPQYFLYLGGFDVRKNVKSVVKGYKAYLDQGGDPSIHLVIAGQLPKVNTEFFPDPREVARALGLDGNICFCGFVDEADKSMIYHLSVGYFFPSLYEGFGMTIIEAMSAGTPAITSRNTPNKL